MKKMEEKIYTKNDFENMQKSFLEELEEVHMHLQNLNIILSKKDINAAKKYTIKLLKSVYDKEDIIKKDIKIEVSNCYETSDTSI